MPPTTILPRDVRTAFAEFLAARGVSLDSARLTDLFTALIDFFQDIRIESCSVAKEEDYLHCEVFQNVISFERLLYVPMEMMHDDCEEGNVGYREKWGLYICTLPNHEPLPDIPDVSDTNLWSFYFPNIVSFADAVQTLPLMRWAENHSRIATEVSFDPVG